MSKIRFKLHTSNSEAFKYYFADFVRKGGTLPPFTDKIFGKKGVTEIWGNPPLTEFLLKTLCVFFQEEGAFDLGGTPPIPVTRVSDMIGGVNLIL